MSFSFSTHIGRLTANPKIAISPKGKERTSFSIACDRDFKNKETGERETDFHNVVIWGSSNYVKTVHLGKGDLVLVAGRTENNDWKDNNGITHKGNVLNCTKIQLLAKKRSDKDQAANDTAAAAQQGTFDQGDYDLPF